MKGRTQTEMRMKTFSFASSKIEAQGHGEGFPLHPAILSACKKFHQPCVSDGTRKYTAREWQVCAIPEAESRIKTPLTAKEQGLPFSQKIDGRIEREQVVPLRNLPPLKKVDGEMLL